MKPTKVKPKVEEIKIRDNSKAKKIKVTKQDREKVANIKLAKQPATKMLLTKEERQELNDFYKIVQRNREAVHGKILAEIYDSGLRSHSKLQAKAFGDEYLKVTIESPRFLASFITGNLTDVIALEKAIRKVRKVMQTNRKWKQATSTP